MLEEGRFCGIFLGVVGPLFLLGVLAKKRVAEGGFLMVNLWWIAGESW